MKEEFEISIIYNSWNKITASRTEKEKQLLDLINKIEPCLKNKIICFDIGRFIGRVRLRQPEKLISNKTKLMTVLPQKFKFHEAYQTYILLNMTYKEFRDLLFNPEIFTHNPQTGIYTKL